MNFTNINLRDDLPDDLLEMLESLHKKINKSMPNITDIMLIEYIIGNWFEFYKRNEIEDIKTKEEVVLRNNLKHAIKLSGKTQAQVAHKIGINHKYLGHVINGRCEPSIVLALLLAQLLCSPSGKLEDIFYLGPVTED